MEPSSRQTAASGGHGSATQDIIRASWGDCSLLRCKVQLKVWYYPTPPCPPHAITSNTGYDMANPRCHGALSGPPSSLFSQCITRNSADFLFSKPLLLCLREPALPQYRTRGRGCPLMPRMKLESFTLRGTAPNHFHPQGGFSPSVFQGIPGKTADYLVSSSLHSLPRPGGTTSKWYESPIG